MANYKRVISYMYVYRNQLKGNNVGFARIETRGNECKITLHIRVVNMKDQEIRSYIYSWYGKELHGVYLGDIHISNGVGELVVKTDIDNVMNAKYRFSEMGGILLYASDAQYIATEWDGKAVIFDSLKIDTVKPQQVLKEEPQPVQESVIAADISEQEASSEAMQPEALEVETAVAMMVPEANEESKEEEVGAEALKEAEEGIEATDVGKSLDEMIEDEVAKEVSDTEVGAEELEKEVPPVHTMQHEVEKKEEPKTGFPLSQEKMEHLDQQAQELFGTMLLNTLFPPEEKEESKEQQEGKVESQEAKEEETVESQQATEELPEDSFNEAAQESPLEEAEAHTQTLSISPKTAIECFTAFRGCESEEEFHEIQEEIQTMQAEIKHLELISKEWKIKQARLLEMAREKAESEKQRQKQIEKREIEEKIRSEYQIDGIESELEAAEVKRALTERIFNKYPKIQPFEDTTVEQCVRIEPQDLGIFPMENWILANNSFLLHGYYSYRHLVFVMEKEDGKYRYLLGVPGVNYSRERFMANMFGFTTFKTLRAEDNESGEFGYWCQEIMM